MTAIGTRVTPQASSCGECGIMTKPTCLPALSKSTVVKAVDERGTDFSTIIVPFAYRDGAQIIARRRATPRETARRLLLVLYTCGMMRIASPRMETKTLAA